MPSFAWPARFDHMRADRVLYLLPAHDVEPLSDATCQRESLRRRQGTTLGHFFSILLGEPPDLFRQCIGDKTKIERPGVSDRDPWILWP
jgi:hypothetical protein